MPQFQKSCLLPFRSKQIFDLINDIKAYPEFISHCTDAKIVESTPTSMVGQLTLKKAGMSYDFTTKNQLCIPLLSTVPYSISMELVNGPFSKLRGEWLIVPKGDGTWCEVNFFIDFEFKQAILNLTFGPLFKQVTHNLVDSFKKRAKEIYEPSTAF